MQMNLEFSSVFLKLINKLHSYQITDIHFVSTFTQKKVKLDKKTHRNTLSQMLCKQVLCKTMLIHWKVNVQESCLNIVAGLQPQTLSRKRPHNRYFPVINLHAFDSSGAQKFLMTLKSKSEKGKYFRIWQCLVHKICSLLEICVVYMCSLCEHMS